jgi:A/G-specific adenine glycosylase
MELGATVCIPRKPKCSICCLKNVCLAYRHNLQDSLPVKNNKKPIPHYDIAAGIIWQRKKILISLRPSKGLLGGLWEFPGGKKENGETLEECLKREVKEELGISTRVKEPFMEVKHAYSHFKITLHTFHCEVISGKPELKVQETKQSYIEDWRWVTLKDLNEYAFPAANRKVIDELIKQVIG